MRNRNVVIDGVRSLCAIYIISFWHLTDYLPNRMGVANNDLLSSFATIGTIISLAGFSFISGFCLSKYKFNSIHDFLPFYTKRLKRFYPLFLLSAISLYLGGIFTEHTWYISTWQFVSTIIGVNLFFPPITMTLWYISMIMFFYFITPFVLYYKNDLCKTSFILLGILAVLLITNHYHKIDYNLFKYLPFYVLGLLIPHRIIDDEFYNKKIYSIASLVLIFVCTWLCFIYNDSNLLFRIVQYIAMLSGVILLFALSNLVKCQFFTFVSYASMTAYLFHRQIYFVSVKLFADAGGYLNIYSALITSIFIFLFSYYLQKYYDRITK